MGKTRKRRKSYTPKQRQSILAVAQKQGLTAEQVKRRFGVTPVTYYSWRKKSGMARPRGQSVRGMVLSGSLAGQVRTSVQARVREILPGIVRAEVNHYLDSILGSAGRRRKV